MKLTEQDRAWIRRTIRRLMREELALFGAQLIEHLEQQPTVMHFGGYDGAHPVIEASDEGWAKLGFVALMSQQEGSRNGK